MFVTIEMCRTNGAAMWFTRGGVRMSILITSAFLFALPLLMTGCASTANNWSNLPTLDLDECARADKFISKNMLSKDNDDSYILVLSYEDQPAASTENQQELLILNLVVIFHLNSSIQGVIDAQSLLVTIVQTASNKNRHWIISDNNGDGLVDKGRFIETVKDAKITFESDAPQGMIQSLQMFFEKASAKMYSIGNVTEECKRRSPQLIL